MKKYFLYGLAILLPCVLTYVIALFFLNIITSPFLPIAKMAVTHFFQNSLPAGAALMMAKLWVLIGLSVVIVFVGFLGRIFLVKKLLKWGDRLVHRLPIISRVYKPIQDLTQTIFSEESESKFSQVVLVPFPSVNDLAIGMVTRNGMPDRSKKTDTLYSVFVPGTPNPSVGFLLSLREEQLIFIDMDVKSALAFVVSCGIVLEKKPQ